MKKMIEKCAGVPGKLIHSLLSLKTEKSVAMKKGAEPSKADASERQSSVDDGLDGPSPDLHASDAYGMNVHKCCTRDGAVFGTEKKMFNGVDIPSISLSESDLSDMPDDRRLKLWATSEWAEYQAWIFHNDFFSCDDWKRMRKKSMTFREHPLISVLTPTYNTDMDMLKDCIRSVQAQTYPHWEMCIADDGSTRHETLESLKKMAALDDRIKLSLSPKNQGICHATNRALAMASGEYLAFLDHDDRLSPAAFYYVAEAVNRNSKLDVIYSDRDMLSLRGLRFMHLFKPDWSPELLFSMNYICHLMVYRRRLVEAVGGIHPEFEGSQDYDLILRVMERTSRVHHIQKVLYHWRQSEQSVALNHNAKDYAYKAGVRALKHALKRRGLKGRVYEISDLWRGHYRVQLKPFPATTVWKCILPAMASCEKYAEIVSAEFANNKACRFLVFIGAGLTAMDHEVFDEMGSWFHVKDVGIVTGKIIDGDAKIVHAGMVVKRDATPLYTYEGADAAEPGYIGSTKVVRNVSAPHPWCFAVRRDVWEMLGGFDPIYKGPHAIIDFALRAGEQGVRSVYTPFAGFLNTGDNGVFQPSSWPDADVRHFVSQWDEWLTNGDAYYNRNLTQSLVDMGLSYVV